MDMTYRGMDRNHDFEILSETMASPPPYEEVQQNSEMLRRPVPPIPQSSERYSYREPRGTPQNTMQTASLKPSNERLNLRSYVWTQADKR
jgi:hypothetical protein